MTAKIVAAGLLTQGHLASLQRDMSMPDQIDLARASAFRLGPIMVEPALRQVTAARSETLEPRVMQVLVVLAMANGGIVSRDDLVRQCWEGRIVGDDSITRVIARLRKLADEHGDGAFRIETITKVGYRLIGSVVLTAPAARPPLASEGPVATYSATAAGVPVLKRRRWLPLALFSALIAAAAVFGWRAAHPPPKPLHTTLRVGTFTTVSAEISPTLPSALESELLRRFGESSNTLISVVREMPIGVAQAYVVSGTVGRSGPNLHYVVNIAREATGESPISLSFDLPAGQGEATIKTVATMSARIVQCTLRGTTEARSVPLPDPAVRLWAQFCRANNAPERDLSFEQTTLREAVEISPDFAVAWGALSLTLASTMSEADFKARRGDYAEATAALASAEKLGLSHFTVWQARALLAPAREWAARGTLFREAAERFTTESNGSATSAYGIFLLNVGRVAKANDQFRLTLQINVVSPVAAARHAMGRSWAGRTVEAEALTREVLATWPGEPVAVQHQISDAIWHGNYAAARAAIAAAPDLEPPVRAAINQTVEALASGDPYAKAAAADRLVALSAAKDTREPFAVAALAALGRDVDALAVAEATFAGNRNPATAILFQPALGRARALPVFAALADRLGLMAYWRLPGNRPDFCSAADAPTLCATLMPRA
jgi:DNA-binding winged helix-turn-helix (wHTH) protein/tetratricopeptide (TPR) repeat protein